MEGMDEKDCPSQTGQALHGCRIGLKLRARKRKRKEMVKNKEGGIDQLGLSKTQLCEVRRNGEMDGSASVRASSLVLGPAITAHLRGRQGSKGSPATWGRRKPRQTALLDLSSPVIGSHATTACSGLLSAPLHHQGALQSRHPLAAHLPTRPSPTPPIHNLQPLQ